jgi:hypothetical protein
VLASDNLVEYALRQTLVADSMSLQFRLPPPGVAAPLARRSDSIAGGSSVVDALVVTSVWAVHILRSLCQVGFPFYAVSLCSADRCCWVVCDGQHCGAAAHMHFFGVVKQQALNWSFCAGFKLPWARLPGFWCHGLCKSSWFHSERCSALQCPVSIL